MNPKRNRRAWLPAAVASAAMTLGLGVLQVLSQDGLDGTGTSRAGTLVALAVLLVVGFGGSWWAIRGIAAGSSAVPTLLSVWMCLVVGTTLAALASFGAGGSGGHAAGPGVVDALGHGALFGVTWGWVAAFLASLVRLESRPATTAPVKPGETRPAARGQAGVVPEGGFVLKRLSDFPEVTLDALPRSGVAVDSRSSVVAPEPIPSWEVPEVSEPEPEPEPEDADLREPEDADLREPEDADLREPEDADLPMPDDPDAQPEDEDPMPVYVGRRAAARAADSPPESLEDQRPGRRTRIDG